jgi:hypothetical protein
MLNYNKVTKQVIKQNERKKNSLPEIQFQKSGQAILLTPNINIIREFNFLSTVSQAERRNIFTFWKKGDK